jgi:hypothetical protein
VAIATAALGISGMSLAFAGTAGAANPNATQIVGTGSQTSYSLMTGFTDIFNQSPGCDLTLSTSLPLQLNCGTSSTAAQPSSTWATATPDGEQGLFVAAENPYNDFAVEAPPIGSGNGISTIKSSANYPGANLANYFARSSSGAPSTPTGFQNFVRYAVDAVSWTAFKKLPTATCTTTHNDCNPAGSVSHKGVINLTQQNLKDIYAYTSTCTASNSQTITDDWSCFAGYAGPTTPFQDSNGVWHVDPIDCYVSQTGSGTYSTFSAFAGFPTPSGGSPIIPACVNHEYKGTAASHQGLFENQMSYISSQADAGYALYFMSYGKYKVTCPSKVCAGTGTDQTAFGEINGIKATQASVQGTGNGNSTPLCTTGPPNCFPLTRGLYNVYNNSNASTNPSGLQVPASDAVLNMISEVGLMCKASSSADIDPASSTGLSYRSEIESVITAAGFFPLDTGGPANTFAQGSPTFPASLTAGTAYDTNDPSPSTHGYCLVTNG